MTQRYVAPALDGLGLAALVAGVFLLVGLAWALLALGVAVLVLNWRYGPA